MQRASIVPCAQCPGCQNYIRVPTSFVSNTYAPTSYNQATNMPRNQTYGPTIRGPPYRSHPSQYEMSWQAKFHKIPILIMGISQLIVSIVIFILEIVSLILSTYSATGAGIWCGLEFFGTAISTILLATKWKRTRVHATRVLICQIILLIFSFTIIGIVGSYLTINNTSYYYSGYYFYSSSFSLSNLSTKYKLMQTQVACSALIMVTGFVYIIFYSIITYLAMWKSFHTLDTANLCRSLCHC
ncbi:unnamed protein product [Adineta steineri]|uniref:Uncharacterized protein n=1 Tax=Adineta steineri TaxID=433720 RepID=A0A818NDS4_9BILA|nr:unnamed protein product [Adineta steineri]CAF3602418.1 unnamed protein product [Adineta steineri]